MSTTSERPSPTENTSIRAGVYDPGLRPRTPRRTGIVIVMIAALLGAGGMQYWARSWQASAVPGQIASSRAGLGSMDSFALALLLGGLRGPLVMFLWVTSEAQKNDKDLEDFDTKIEWIRMLQPEFDTVHMFQIWNKAYNISVMMASPVTKYQTIIGAIEYAQDVLAERPDDLNIFESLGQVYGNKMSGESTQERPFYTRQFRLESMNDETRKKMYPDDTDFHRIGPTSFIFLDENGNILAPLLAPTRQRPEGIAADMWNDGSMLQWLKPYEPFPYGILPLAMAYNYDKAADAAMLSENQMPLQLSPLVTDSKPGLDLKLWAEAEANLAIGLTGQAFGVDADTTPGLIDDISLNQNPRDPAALKEAEYRFGLSSRLAADAIVQYKRHLANPAYLVQAQTYASHLMDLQGMTSLSKADQLFSQSFLTNNPAARQTLLEDAAQNYHTAMIEYEREVLVFYTEDGLAMKVLHDQFDKIVPASGLHDYMMNLPDKDVQTICAAVTREAAQPNDLYAPHHEDRQLYSIPIIRAERRYDALTRALSPLHR